MAECGGLGVIWGFMNDFGVKWRLMGYAEDCGVR